jgi:hypothetical protein
VVCCGCLLSHVGAEARQAAEQRLPSAVGGRAARNGRESLLVGETMQRWRRRDGIARCGRLDRPWGDTHWKAVDQCHWNPRCCPD